MWTSPAGVSLIHQEKRQGLIEDDGLLRNDTDNELGLAIRDLQVCSSKLAAEECGGMENLRSTSVVGE